MAETPPIDLITISQAIIVAHQKSDERQERLLLELPKLLVSQQHYDARHTELERRVGLVETAIDHLETKVGELPDRIMEKIDTRQNMSRTQQVTLVIATANGLIAIGIGLFNIFFHH